MEGAKSALYQIKRFGYEVVDAPIGGGGLPGGRPMVGRSVAGRKPILERWQQIGGAEVALTPRRAEEAATTRRPDGRARAGGRSLSFPGRGSGRRRRREPASEKAAPRKTERAREGPLASDDPDEKGFGDDDERGRGGQRERIAWTATPSNWGRGDSSHADVNQLTTPFLHRHWI